MHSDSLWLKVDAEPRSQGSMTAVYNRRLGVSRVRHANAPALSIWRNTVARNAIAEGATIWEGPIGMAMSFGIKEPKDIRHGYPKSPDLDKLVRAVLDALTGVCYANDNQVVWIEADKVWRNHTLIGVWQVEKQASANQESIWTQDAARMGAASRYRTRAR